MKIYEICGKKGLNPTKLYFMVVGSSVLLKWFENGIDYLPGWTMSSHDGSAYGRARLDGRVNHPGKKGEKQNIITCVN
jgi:hypothetical protein